VPAVGAVNMVVIRVDFVGHNFFFSFVDVDEGTDSGLASMLQGCPDELAHMVIRERIEDVLAFAPALHDTLGVEHT
jgi:hypothetical protein